MNELQLTIARITQMELYLEQVQKAISKDFTPQSLASVQEALFALTDYFEHGLWLSDYEKDERGELPSDLKRGVLSQDTLYNLLQEIEEML